MRTIALAPPPPAATGETALVAIAPCNWVANGLLPVPAVLATAGVAVGAAETTVGGENALSSAEIRASVASRDIVPVIGSTTRGLSLKAARACPI
jgi:hypothetical protein